MELYDEILTATSDTIDEYGQDYIYLEEAVADAVFKRIKNSIGGTQEKLLEQLEQARSVQTAAERRAEALEGEVSDLLQARVSQ